MASQRLNARIAKVKSSGRNEGFLETPDIKLPKTIPAPIDPAS